MTKSQEIRVAELWFLSTAFLNNVCCQRLKFQVESFFSLEVMTRIQSENKQKAKFQMQSVAELWFF